MRKRRMYRVPYWSWPETWWSEKYWSHSGYYDTFGDLKMAFRYQAQLFALIHQTMITEASQECFRYQQYEKINT